MAAGSPSPVGFVVIVRRDSSMRRDHDDVKAGGQKPGRSRVVGRTADTRRSAGEFL